MRAGKLAAGGAAFAAVLALAACEQAQMKPEAQTQVNLLTSEFQNVCGALARTGSLDAARQAALRAGYKSDGVVRNSVGYDFRDFEHLTKGALQVQLSDKQISLGLLKNANFCGIVAEASGGKVSNELLKASADAMAKANGTVATTPPMIRVNDYGSQQFSTGGHTVRLGHQSYPAGLVLYTFTGNGKN